MACVFIIVKVIHGYVCRPLAVAGVLRRPRGREKSAGRMAMYEFLDYQVADAMTYRPVTVGAGTPLAEVEALFERHDFNSLPVVSRDGILVGVVTKLDFLTALDRKS